MLGKIFGIVITFLGVGMVAIPTGIISAVFVEQYSRIKKRSEYGYELDVHFLKISIILAMIKRQEQLIIPRGDVVIEEDDIIILGAEPYDEVEKINLTEVVLKREHVWTGHGIKRLDISKHSLIVIVKRKNKTLIPNGNMVLHSGDRVIMYTNMNLGNATVDEI